MTYTLDLRGTRHTFEEDEHRRAVQRAFGLVKAYGKGDGWLQTIDRRFQKMIPATAPPPRRR